MLEWQSDLLGPEAAGGGLSPVQQASMVRSAGNIGTASPGAVGAGAAEAMEGAGSASGAAEAAGQLAPALLQEQQVRVVILPAGDYEQVARGTTAGDIIRLKVRAS